MRGHCVFWGKEEYVPEWLKPLTPAETQQEMNRRIDYVVPRYAGWLVIWLLKIDNNFEIINT